MLILLSVPPRLLDIFSIVLISAGVNFATGAIGGRSGIAEICSGIMITLAGVVVLLLRYEVEDVWTAARASQDVEKAVADRWWGVDRGGDVAGGRDLDVPMPQIREFGIHLTAAIKDTLQRRGGRIRGMAAIALLCAAGGVSLGVRSYKLSTTDISMVEPSASAHFQTVLEHFETVIVMDGQRIEESTMALEAAAGELGWAREALEGVTRSLEPLSAAIERMRREIRDTADAQKRNSICRSPPESKTRKNQPRRRRPGSVVPGR